MASFNNNGLSGRTILLVNTGTLKKKFIIQRLKSLGLTIVVLNKEKNWAEPYVDHWILADTANHTESVQSVRLHKTTWRISLLARGALISFPLPVIVRLVDCCDVYRIL